MDLQERLADYIDGLETGIDLYNEYNSTENSFSLYSLVGGRTVREFMDGTKEKELNFELQLKIKLNDRDKGYNALALISRKLEELETLESKDGSFKFKKIKVSSDPYFMDAQQDNFIYYRFTFIVDVLTD
jgi:hypothetical protein|nr:MAG TPA: Minor capsid protein [Caudoviricetes sp.]